MGPLSPPLRVGSTDLSKKAKPPVFRAKTGGSAYGSRDVEGTVNKLCSRSSMTPPDVFQTKVRGPDPQGIQTPAKGLRS